MQLFVQKVLLQLKLKMLLFLWIISNHAGEHDHHVLSVIKVKCSYRSDCLVCCPLRLLFFSFHLSL